MQCQLGCILGIKASKPYFCSELNMKTGFLSKFRFRQYFIDVSHPNSIICLNLTARQSFCIFNSVLNLIIIKMSVSRQRNVRYKFTACSAI